MVRLPRIPQPLAAGPRLVVTPVTDTVHHCSTDLASWVLVEEDGQVTLVDAGYPGDAGRVLESLATIGRRPEDVAAVLVTHAHVDHIGSLPALGLDAPVLTGEEEARHARREYLQQASERDVAARAWQPRVLAWSLRILPLGATRDVRIAAPRAVAPGEPLDVPGRPVPVPTPGHTDGHTAYHFPAAGCVATGDALVTGHPATGIHHPHLLPGFFTHDQARAERSLDAIAALDADRILPGHGLTWSGPASRAVELARERYRG